MWRPGAFGLAVATVLAVLAGNHTAQAGDGPPRTTPESVRIPLATYALVAPKTESASGLIARAVFAAGQRCPDLSATVVTRKGPRRVHKPMKPRVPAETTQGAFGSLLVCEVAMPLRATAATIAGRSLPAALPRDISRIALFGDTGCRIKGSNVQDCNDPKAWPLAQNALSIARERPDVTIFLGDFYYREEECPEWANSLCGGSPAPLVKAPFKDSAWGWIADVLVPMAPLLPAAPIVMVRGNHELCERGGNGFFLLFDPAFGTARACAPSADGEVPVVYSPTTAVDLSVKGKSTLRLVNVDSANGDDAAVNFEIAAQQRLLFERAQRLARGADEAWLLTHRPVAGHFSSTLLPDPPSQALPWGSLTQAYASYGLLNPYGLMLSSHIHLAQVNSIPGLPPEVILGNGGTKLEPPTGYDIPPFGPLADAAGQSLVPGLAPLPTATMSRTWPRFGYAMAHPTSRGWRIDLKSEAGKRFANCQISGSRVVCR